MPNPWIVLLCGLAAMAVVGAVAYVERWIQQ
jgi:hypothetical protein